MTLREHPAYVEGFRLLARGAAFEAHERWEEVWRPLDRASTDSLLLKALVRLAAAHVKAARGEPRGVRAHAEAAEALFHDVAARTGASTRAGVDLDAAAACAARARLDAERYARPVVEERWLFALPPPLLEGDPG